MAAEQDKILLLLQCKPALLVVFFLIQDRIMHCATLASPVGILRIYADEQHLYRISFPRDDKTPLAGPAPEDHPLLGCAMTQLAEYFAKQRRRFTLPISPQGTSFQQAVWTAMQRIPYGETRTYRDIAGAV